MTAPAEAACSSCGAALQAANGYLTPVGLVCWPCFERLQSKQEHADRLAATLEVSLTRRARTLTGLHGVMWSAAALVSSDKASLQASFSTLLLAAVLLLVVGLFMRWRLAFLTALGFDAAGALALIIGGLAHGASGWPLVLLAVFPLALVTLTWALRAAYAEELVLAAAGAVTATKRPRRINWRWLLPAVAVAGLVTMGALRRHRPTRRDPAREVVGTLLPAWQLARARPWSQPAGPAARELLGRSRAWPALAGAFETLDRVWPDEAAVRDAVGAVNRALVDAKLPYFTNSWMVVDRPYVLSHDLVARVPWRIGTRTVDVLRLRRLDTLGIDFAFDGVTAEGQPVVMLDRVEANLAKELPAMYGKPGDPKTYDEFDRAALTRLRTWFEARLGPGVATAAAALAERDRLLEEMRTRFRGGSVQLATPDGFVLGASWLEDLEPETKLTRPGGPLFLDTDLTAVVEADQKLREPATTKLLDAAVDLMARSTEAHEARHALDVLDPVGPPPPALFEVMPDSSTKMIGMADRELRAFLGELHDGPLPVCAELAQIMRSAHGYWARREPHHFAVLAIARELGADPGHEPARQLTSLCATPDAELRDRVSAAWMKLYTAPMPASQRSQ